MFQDLPYTAVDVISITAKSVGIRLPFECCISIRRHLRVWIIGPFVPLPYWSKPLLLVKFLFRTRSFPEYSSREVKSRTYDVDEAARTLNVTFMRGTAKLFLLFQPNTYPNVSGMGRSRSLNVTTSLISVWAQMRNNKCTSTSLLSCPPLEIPFWILHVDLVLGIFA